MVFRRTGVHFQVPIIGGSQLARSPAQENRASSGLYGNPHACVHHTPTPVPCHRLFGFVVLMGPRSPHERHSRCHNPALSSTSPSKMLVLQSCAEKHRDPAQEADYGIHPSKTRFLTDGYELAAPSKQVSDLEHYARGKDQDLCGHPACSSTFGLHWIFSELEKSLIVPGWRGQGQKLGTMWTPVCLTAPLV